MNDAGAVRHSHIVIAVDKKCLLVLREGGILCALIERLIFLVLEVFALEGFKDDISLSFRNLSVRHVVLRNRSKYLVRKRCGKIIGIPVSSLDLDIRLLRVHAECDIRRKCPRRGGPCEEICILALYFEADDSSAVLDRLIALRDLVTGKRSAAARAVRNNLEAFVEKALVPDGLQSPPLGLNIIIIVSDIGMLHVSPEADLSGELLPHALVFPYRFLALLNERLKAIGHDLFLLVLLRDADFLLDFELDRKTVGIPAGLSRDLFALHRMVSRNHILDDTGLNMADVRLSVRRRRPIVKHINRVSFVFLDTLLKNPVFLPELGGFFFPLNKIEIRIDLLIHGLIPFLYVICCNEIESENQCTHSITAPKLMSRNRKAGRHGF